MRVLVTGGSGFIGRHLLRSLTSSSKFSEVISLDKSPLPTEFLADVPVKETVADLRDERSCLEASKGVDSVIHLGAVVSVPESIRTPRRTHEVNSLGTLNVLEAARENNVPHIVVASSSAVYGEHPVEKKHEQLPVQFLSPYAASKGTTESYALAYGASYGLKTVAYRFFNVFGPGQTADHPYAAVIPRFLAAIREQKPLQVYGDGEQTRDFVSVHTVVEALVQASAQQLSSPSPVNIASGNSISLNDLINHLSQLHAAPLDVQYLPERPGDIRHSGASTEALHQLLPKLNQTDFEQALREVYEWYLE